ncbi:Protein N-acetyltransferase, RimJ/RimL family [Filimonas lacunae]|uniref:Protein N-acetyltransferase, RimJ/RimL family n=1 Tax=Filimonas lacunae TaxID=477680 RepID=A0A173MEU3_9BACT|nr:GNAT family N-acetyltransferase [Filimonas lacunae]BAV05999.1 GCN5-related N-acetyltransferase [Filimonas lacunae]SIT24125.1 Protein N-acetyltransferase, RimJ/RimL family [Filimonas lacunae]
MSNIIIKRVTLHDIEALQQIGRQTFAETFAPFNSAENMATYLEEGFAYDKLAAELQKENSEFYFAMLDNAVIGYLKLNTGDTQTELKEQGALEIERIYVQQEFHGKRVGQLLYDKAIAVAIEKQVQYVWLGVWEKNSRAIRFYQKNGFVAFDKHLFQLGNDVQTDFMMRKRLDGSLEIQPLLENENVILYPLRESDFDSLYAVASDPKVWEQHPNKNRWQLEVFRTFFDGAIQSKGAFKIVDKTTGKAIGCTRFYDYNPQEKSIFIGYTFYGTISWGKGINQQVKALMLEYIFPFVNQVFLHVGAHNIRSQIAVGRTGAKKIGEQAVAYFGETSLLNFVYVIEKESWRM